jgi:hypothetical protein
MRRTTCQSFFSPSQPPEEQITTSIITCGDPFSPHELVSSDQKKRTPAMTWRFIMREMHEPGHYEIRIKGHLENRWVSWFEGLTITTLDNGETVLTGPVVDQAALHGLLRKVRDLGLPLLSVTQVEPCQAESSDVKETYQHRSKKE